MADKELEKLKQSQEAFLAMIQSSEDDPIAAPESPHAVRAKTPERLSVYRESYYARIISAAISSTFERVRNFMGERFAYEMLRAFYEIRRPSGETELGMGEGLVTFVEEYGDTEKHPYLIDLIKLSQMHSQLNLGKDGQAGESSEDLSQLTLKSEHAYLPASYPLYSIWTKAEEPVAEDEQGVIPNDEPAGVLLLKDGAYNIFSASVPKPLHGIMAHLQEGLPLLEAISKEERNLEGFPLEEFQTWIAVLTNCKAWAVKSP